MKTNFEFAQDATSALIDAAAAAGYPEIALPTGTTILAGDDAWARFIETGSDAERATAHTLLTQRLDTRASELGR
jgi:hypothetical protein